MPSKLDTKGSKDRRMFMGREKVEGPQAWRFH